MMTSQLSRIHVYDNPPAAPGHCALCGTSQGPMIDFGMNVEFYGVVYFCVATCLVEVANSFEYISPQQWHKLSDHSSALQDEVNQLRNQNEQLRSTVNSFTVFSSSTSIARTPELNLSQDVHENDEQLSFDFTSGEDNPVKQDDVRRPANVLNDEYDDGLDNFLSDNL